MIKLRVQENLGYCKKCFSLSWRMLKPDMWQKEEQTWLMTGFAEMWHKMLLMTVTYHHQLSMEVCLWMLNVFYCIQKELFSHTMRKSTIYLTWQDWHTVSVENAGTRLLKIGKTNCDCLVYSQSHGLRLSRELTHNCRKEFTKRFSMNQFAQKIYIYKSCTVLAWSH